MPSINVYVSDDLKARMDRAAEGVNWSSVAQGAFERALASIPAMEGSKMSAVLERLKASKAEQVDSVAAAGFAAGRRWAENEADYLTLRRVGEYDWSGFGEEIGVEFERVARIDPEAFWANHPKDASPRGVDVEGTATLPPVPPLPPDPPGARVHAHDAHAQRVEVRVRRAVDHAMARVRRHHHHDLPRPSPFYVEGFAKGAASVWREVKNAL
jgi:hypothetical protein